MLTVNVPYDNLSLTVKLFRNDVLEQTLPVSTPGQAGSVGFPYQTPPAGVSVFKAKAANTEGESPFSLPATFISGIPTAPGTITFVLT